MFESFDAVDRDDGDVPPVATDERGVGVDVDLLQGEEVAAICRQNFAFRLLAQVTAGARVERDLSLSRNVPVVMMIIHGKLTFAVAGEAGA